MWKYVQKTGDLFRDEQFVGSGYSGYGAGLNNPGAEGAVGLGPVPLGYYSIGTPFHHPICGPCSMALIADEPGQLHGRSGFLIHGDSVAMDHTASHGCIILGRALRDAIANSSDRRLTVVGYAKRR